MTQVKYSAESTSRIPDDSEENTKWAQRQTMRSSSEESKADK